MLKSVLKGSIYLSLQFKQKFLIQLHSSMALKLKTHNFPGICKANETILTQLLVARNHNTSYNIFNDIRPLFVVVWIRRAECN
jgi:hypothetical protein